MNRLFTVVVTGLLLVGTVGAMPGVLAQSTTPTTTQTTPTDGTSDDQNASVAPGERLAGVVGVGKAEVSGEVAARAFGFAYANASTNRTRARLIGQQVGDLDRQLATLRERQQELRRAHANGSISHGRYRAEMAQVVAQVRAVNRLANGTQSASRGVPADLLQRNGVNATAIQRLRLHADELTGPEVAAIARTIAGPRAGAGLGRGPPSELVGPGGVGAPGRGSGPNGSMPASGHQPGGGPAGNQTDRPGTGAPSQDRPGRAANRSTGSNRDGRGR